MGESALLLIDLQPDFMPGGALAVPEGDAIVPHIARAMTWPGFSVRVATQDWHPRGHVSFASTHAGRKPLEVVDLYGHEQVLWPDHCVPGTPGAALHPDLPWDRVDLILRKGMDPRVDSYSGFRHNWGPEGTRPSTGLAAWLRERGVDEVWLCGLARDFCVKWSAEDAAAEGFRTYFLWDLTRPVDPANDARVRADLERAGVTIVEGLSAKAAQPLR
jgi:nicotinamidase/pyrazinamidase